LENKDFILGLISGGLIAIFSIVISSILSYITEICRNKKEEKRKLLKNIYFKIYTDIKYCFYTQNTFGKEHKVAKPITIFDVKNNLEVILEENIGIIDNRLFNLYNRIKSEQFFIDSSSGTNNYKYLSYFGSLLKYMLDINKTIKLFDKYYKKEVEDLYYKYVIWFILMKRIKDWEKVENILNKDFHFKRSYKEITKSRFLNNIHYNKKINTDEYIKIFIEYVRFEIPFPIFYRKYGTK